MRVRVRVVEAISRLNEQVTKSPVCASQGNPMEKICYGPVRKTVDTGAAGCIPSMFKISGKCPAVANHHPDKGESWGR